MKKRRRLKKGFRYSFTLIGVILFLSLTFVVVQAFFKEEDFKYLPLRDYLSNIQISKEDVREQIREIPIKEKYEYTYVSFDVLDNGEEIYTPKGSGYRYGPSIINNEDGSRDIWFARPGNNSTEWDYISYMHQYEDGTFSAEKIVLRPTPNSLDKYSTCDPGVIYFNDYYYLAYTSTIDPTDNGVNNELYVARSKNPDGPYEKWNGNGWGGKPEPIIQYPEYDGGWGVGEPSLVIKDETLFIYYSYINLGNNVTRVMTAELCEDWPLTLKGERDVFHKKNNQDSCDVVYLDGYDKFLAFAVRQRLTAESSIIIYESEDGFNFETYTYISDYMEDYIHNMGISKGLDGHITIDDDLVICYAYSKNNTLSWGKWSTRMQPIKLKYITEEEYR